ncbi:MAG: 4-alpha-glucanotransferase [Waddliaceae bacterium]
MELHKTNAYSHWKKIGIKPHHGVCIPLFSLHSQESCGIGEFPDLLPIIDWLKTVSMDIIQLLPINDTGDQISPYSPISATALNPLYLGISRLPSVKESPLIRSLKKLTGAPFIDYEKVREGKEKFLRHYFHEMFPTLEKSKPYKEFVQNHPWLKDYADFMRIKKPQDNRDFYYFVQFLCYRQLKEVKKRADRKGVMLKGDIPILISTDSSDVALHPELFDTRLSFGAPPDQYATNGQNWGFPLYRWEDEKEKILKWWKDRLQYQESFFHMYRIDHVVGLFRAWAIPKGNLATEGEYIPKDRRKWIPQGRSILQSFLDYTSMFPIAEDLGTVPDSVRKCLHEMGIPGTKVMRWEKRGTNSYILPKNYPRDSMTCLSTHDTETLQQWWNHTPSDAKNLAKSFGLTYQKRLSMHLREEILKLSHQSSSYFHINLLQEYFPLVPGMSWDKPDSERINRPDLNSKKNWRCRYRPSVDEITSNSELKKKIREIID